MLTFQHFMSKYARNYEVEAGSDFAARLELAFDHMKMEIDQENYLLKEKIKGLTVEIEEAKKILLRLGKKTHKDTELYEWYCKNNGEENDN